MANCITIGDATLYHGDCLEILPTLDKVDAVIADPPYGITANKWDVVIPFESIWEIDSQTFVLIASQPFSSMAVMSNVSLFRHEWIWKKNRGSNFLNTKREPMKEHESVLVFAEKNWTFNRQMEGRSENGYTRSKMPLKLKVDSENYRKIEGMKQTYIGEKRVPSSVQKFKTAAGKVKTIHPTQKPVELMEYLIKTYTNVGNVVLDFSMGSGTTGVACANLGRKFIGIETEQKYFDVACERIDQAQRQLRMFA